MDEKGRAGADGAPSAPHLEARVRRAAEAARRACLAAFRDAYEDAALRGLCGEGAVEVALDRVRHLDLDAALREDEEAHPASGA